MMIYNPPDYTYYENLAKEFLDLFDDYIFDIIESQRYVVSPGGDLPYIDEDEEKAQQKIDQEWKAIVNTALDSAIRDFQNKYHLPEQDMEKVLNEFDKLKASRGY